MSLKERTINVDIMTKEYTKLKYKQGDSNQTLKFKFYKNGSELDLSGYVAGIFYEKPNNEVLEKRGNISSNTVTTTITSGILNTAGIVKTEIFLTKDTEVTISFTILIEVESSIDKNAAVQEKEEWDVIKDLLNGANNGGNVNVPENVALVMDVAIDGITEDYIPIMSSNGTEYKLTISNAGVPIVKDTNGNVVFTCGTGGSSSGGGTGGETPPSGGDTGEIVSGEPYVLQWTDGIYISDINGKEEAHTNWTSTQYIPVYGADYVEVVKGSFTNKYNAFYDINKNFIESINMYLVKHDLVIPSTAVFLRISCEITNKDGYIVTPYILPGATWTDGVAYNLELINDKYYNNGELVGYSGWSATELLNCVGASKLTITGNTKSTQYCHFFNPGRVSISQVVVNAGDSVEIEVPEFACYFAMSNSTAVMNSVTITPHR